jgi:class 3 adenylate cyclase/tetratricopeptide (TPR) repeat protein
MSRQGEPDEVIGELLDHALDAANRGDITTVHRLAGEVLAEDATNLEAGELMTSELSGSGELRRATLMFCDLVGSTELSTRHEPELYRTLVRRYKAECRHIIEDRYDGHVVGSKGDGLLALFGIPRAHGDDVERAIRAGLDVVRSVHDLSAKTEQQLGESLDVRVAVHRGIVYLDNEEDDVYGMTVNVAARLEGLAEPGTVVVSEEVRGLADAMFVLEPQPARAVKGVEAPLRPYRVRGRRTERRVRPRHAPTKLVGRTDELERLQAAWQDIRDGSTERPTAILLRGEAGIGKTRVAAAIAEIAELDGATVLELFGSPFHVETGFHPVRMLIERRAGIDSDADGTDRLARLRGQLQREGLEPDALVPLLAPILGIDPNAGYQPAHADGRKLHEDVSQAAIEYVEACLGASPALLIVEDIQWYDESSRSVLDRVAARLGTRRLVVFTGRPDAAPPNRAEVFEIGPLSAVESHWLLEEIGPAGLDDDLRGNLVDRSDGVPLYLEELAHAATEGGSNRGAASDRSAGNAGPRGADTDRSTVPDVLYEVLVARLYATPDAAPVAAAAATIGREIDHALLRDVLDMSEAELEHAIRTLLAEHVLERDGPAQSRFRHELLRDVAYELQPPSKRRQLHARLGDALVRRRADTGVVDWALAANHFERAEMRDAASDALEHAADEARQRGALTEAITNLTRAIESIEGVRACEARDRREVELRLRRGFLATSIEGNASAGAAADYSRCLSLAGLDAADEEMFRTLIVLWGYFVVRAELERAHQVLTILRGALIGQREIWVPFNTAGFGMLNWYKGDFTQAQTALEAAGAEARTIAPDDEVLASWLNPMDPWASIHIHLALARFVRGLQPWADEANKEAADRAGSLGFPQGPYSAAYVLAFTAWMRLEVEDFDGADEAIERLTSLSLQHGFDVWTLVAVTEQTTAQALRALHASAEPGVLTSHAGLMRGLIGTWDQFDVKVMLPFYWTALGTVTAAAGDAVEARSHFEASLALAKSTGMHFYDAETLRRAAVLNRDRAEIATALKDALRTARSQGARLFELRAALDLWDHDPRTFSSDLQAAARGFVAGAPYPEVGRAMAALTRQG